MEHILVNGSVVSQRKWTFLLHGDDQLKETYSKLSGRALKLFGIDLYLDSNLQTMELTAWQKLS